MQSRTKSRNVFNLAILLAVIGCGFTAYYGPWKEWLINGQHLKARLAEWGMAAPAIFTVSTALLTTVGMPRLVLCSVGGLAFGGWGVVWSQIGTLAGSYLTFLFVRWSGQDLLLRRYRRLAELSRRFEERGILAVLLIRQMPMSGLANNVLLGFSTVSHRDFLLGSFLGFLPLGLAATLAGAGIIQTSAADLIRYLLIAVLCAVVLGVLLKWTLCLQHSPVIKSQASQLLTDDE
jgi:uncharacterized membrane protein YdjX (TVP38/TMEM64 family)